MKLNLIKNTDEYIKQYISRLLNIRNNNISFQDSEYDTNNINFRYVKI